MCSVYSFFSKVLRVYSLFKKALRVYSSFDNNPEIFVRKEIYAPKLFIVRVRTVLLWRRRRDSPYSERKVSVQRVESSDGKAVGSEAPKSLRKKDTLIQLRVLAASYRLCANLESQI